MVGIFGCVMGPPVFVVVFFMFRVRPIPNAQMFV